MGQSKSAEIGTGSIHYLDKDRVLLFNSCQKAKLGDWKEFENKIQTDNELNRGTFGVIWQTKNDPNLVTKTIDTYYLEGTNKHSLGLSICWNEYVLMKKTQILFYDKMYCKGIKIAIVMEKLSYSLENYLVQYKHKHNCNLNEQQTKLIIFDVLNCLYKIHLTNYVHSDLAPDNIMFRARDKDFKYLNSNTVYKKGWVIIDYEGIHKANVADYRYGKKGWIAPEINQYKYKYNAFLSPTYTFACDLWAIGLLILYCLFKEQPFAIRKNNKFTEKELGCFLHNLLQTNKVSPDLYILLKDGLLVFDANKRLQTVEQVYQQQWFDSIRETDLDIGDSIQS